MSVGDTTQTTSPAHPPDDAPAHLLYPADLVEPPVREECGVFGVWAPGEDVSRLSYFGLYALQHRGQESASS